MRAVVIILILAIVGFLVYTQFFSLTEEEKMVKAVENEFDEAVGNFLRAGRTMAGTGLDTTSDVDDAVRKIRKADKELQELMTRLTEESAKKRAEKLKNKIKTFTTKNDIDLY
jgi:pyridoxal biosynthesis lyase PdxS